MKKTFSFRDFSTVFMHYLKKETRSRVYLIVTVLLCSLSLASCFILNAFFGEKEKKPLYIIDRTALFSDAFQNAELPGNFFEGVSLDFTADQSLPDEKLSQMVSDEEGGPFAVFSQEADGIKLTIIDSGTLSSADTQAFLTLSQSVYLQYNIEAAGISPETYQNASRQLIFEEVDPSQQSGNFWTAYILYMLMVIAIVMYSVSAGNEVAYLKTNKVMEVVTTSIRPLPFYLGVTLSIGLSGLIQLAAIVLCSALSFRLAGTDLSVLGDMGITLSSMTAGQVTAYLLLFIGGFLLFSFVNTAVASIVNRTDDVASTLVPLEMLAMVQFFISLFALDSDSFFTAFCSFLPITSPSVMFVRYMMGFAGTSQLIISILLLYASALAMAVIGSRFFSRGVVHYGTIREFSLKGREHS